MKTTTLLADVASELKGKTQTLFGQAGYLQDNVTGGVGIALRIGVIFNTILLLVGILFLGFTVYSGIQWMIAGGNEELVTRARKRIIRATIGLIIIVGAWVITSTILRAVFGSMGTPRGQVEFFRRF